LEENKVAPTAKLATDCRHPANFVEAKSPVKANGRSICTIDGTNHRVLPAFACQGDQCAHEFPAKAVAPVVLPNMDRVLDSESVSGPSYNVPEAPECCNAYDFARHFGDEDGLMVIEPPRQDALLGVWNVSPFDRRRCQEGIEERGNVKGIVDGGGPNDHR